MRPYNKLLVILATLIVLGLGIGVIMFGFWHQDDTVTPQVEGNQERIDRGTSRTTEAGEPHKDSEATTRIDTPEQVERKITEIIEHLEVLHTPEPSEEEEEKPPAPADPVAAAWARLEYISQNPQEWGEFSSEATELMEELTPTWRTKNEGETEEAIILLEKLGKLQDPRSAEIFVNYLRESGLWGRPMEEALIAIGPPSVPLLVPLLDDNDSFLKRKRAAELLGIIGAEYRQELGGAVEYLILPRLEQMTTSDPHPRVRQYAHEAVTRLR